MLLKEKKQDSRGSFEVFRRRDWIEHPEISVVMSVYNAEDTVKYAIESIINQTFKNFEFIIINDGSTDGTFDILMEYFQKDNRIIIINQKNIGLTKSLNRGIEIARGRYIARQDADDVSLEERFEKQIKYLKKEYELVCCRTLLAEQNRYSPKWIIGFLLNIPFFQKIILSIKNPFIHGTFMIRKSILIKLGGYDESFYYAQDYKLLVKLVLTNIRIKYILTPFYVSYKSKRCISIEKKRAQKFFANKAKQYLKQAKKYIKV